METERLGDKLDRELRCGDPRFDWFRYTDFLCRNIYPCRRKGEMGVSSYSEPPCGKPLGQGQHWKAWSEMGLRHAQCPNCKATTMYQTEEEAEKRRHLRKAPESA